MTIFFVMDALAVIFLLYALAQFWMEGHRGKNRTGLPPQKSRPPQAAKVIAMTPSISLRRQTAVPVIDFAKKGRAEMATPARKSRATKALEMPGRRVS